MVRQGLKRLRSRLARSLFTRLPDASIWRSLALASSQTVRRLPHPSNTQRDRLVFDARPRVEPLAERRCPSAGPSTKLLTT
jgi:hypothetical protein